MCGVGVTRVGDRNLARGYAEEKESVTPGAKRAESDRLSTRHGQGATPGKRLGGGAQG